MKALLALPLVALVAACAAPLSADSARAQAAREDYLRCVSSEGMSLAAVSSEEARDIALTAVGVCRPKLLLLAGHVEDDNGRSPERRVFAHEYANNIRDKALADVAAAIMRSRDPAMRQGTAKARNGGS